MFYRHLIFVVLPAVAVAHGQEPAAAPLAVRQEHVLRLMDELERKFMAHKLAISEAEPERAERLQEALNRAKEMLLQKRMADVAQQLSQAQLDAAGDSQKELLADIRALLTFLLDESSSRPSTSDELKALAEWKQQMQRLVTEERDLQTRVDNLPNDAAKSEFEKIAQSQDDLADRTIALNKQLTKPTGQQPLAGAQQAMQQASRHLSNQDSANASRQQTSAIEQLLEAIKEVEQRSRELSREAKQEMQARLAALFRAMLERQRQLTAQTIALHAKQSNSTGQLTRGDRLAVRAIGESERSLDPLARENHPPEPGLAGKAKEALDLLGDGESPLLKSLIEQLQGDLILVGGRLADDLQTDERTISLQKEIEEALLQLSDALQQAQQSQSPSQSSESASSGSDQQNKQALLPASAQLKLLRAGQIQINRRTAAIDRSRQQNPGEDQSVSKETQQLADRQAALAALAAELLAQQKN
jgi:hypothetical protein